MSFKISNLSTTSSIRKLATSFYDLGLFQPCDPGGALFWDDYAAFLESRGFTGLGRKLRKRTLLYFELRHPALYSQPHHWYWHRDGPDTNSRKEWLLVWASIHPTLIRALPKDMWNELDKDWYKAYQRHGRQAESSFEGHGGVRIPTEAGHVYLFRNFRYEHSAPPESHTSNRWFARIILPQKPS